MRQKWPETDFWDRNCHQQWCLKCHWGYLRCCQAKTDKAKNPDTETSWCIFHCDALYRITRLLCQKLVFPDAPCLLDWAIFRVTWRAWSLRRSSWFSISLISRFWCWKFLIAVCKLSNWTNPVWMAGKHTGQNAILEHMKPNHWKTITDISFFKNLHIKISRNDPCTEDKVLA